MVTATQGGIKPGDYALTKLPGLGGGFISYLGKIGEMTTDGCLEFYICLGEKSVQNYLRLPLPLSAVEALDEVALASGKIPEWANPVRGIVLQEYRKSKENNCGF